MFATERVSVGPNQTIAIALGWFATTLTYHLRNVLDHPKAEEIADSTLRYWTDEWIEQQGGRDHQELWTEVETLPEVVQKTMAAGFEYVGTRLRTTDYSQSDPERPTETEDPKDVQIGQLLRAHLRARALGSLATAPDQQMVEDCGAAPGRADRPLRRARSRGALVRGLLHRVDQVDLAAHLVEGLHDLHALVQRHRRALEQSGAEATTHLGRLVP